MVKPKITLLKAGSRGSPLALRQIDEIEELLKRKKVFVQFQRDIYETSGDKNKKISLVDHNDDYFFTDALDQALLNHEIDIAIHSAKDLPKKIREGLSIFALTPSADETDCFCGKMPIEQLPSGSKVGTSSLIRQKQLKELYPKLQWVDIRGTIQERLQLVDKGFCDGIIAATIALKRLGLQDKIQNIMPWEGAPLQGQLAVVGRKSDVKVAQLFEPIDVRKNYGKVVLVGAGPGDPELITVKGMQALKEADCVFYDYLVDKMLLQYAPRAEHIFVGKRKGSHTLDQAELSHQLRLKAMEGKNIVRLKGGDPFIFGRGADELEYLRSYHIQVDVIPGLSSATAIPSSLQIPLTARGISSSVAFLSAHGEDEKIKLQTQIDIPKADTLVFLMGLTKIDVIIRSLLKSGWQQSTPIALISKGTRIDEKILTGTIFDIQSKLNKEKLEPPVLIIVGKIINFLNDSFKKPKTILYTGTYPEQYQGLGDVIHWPMIELRPVKLSASLSRKIVKKFPQYEMILLTSRFGVKYFFEFIKKHKLNTDLKDKIFIVIGKHTAEVLRHEGIEPSLIAEDETSEGAIKVLKQKFLLKGKQILFPRSSLPNLTLKNELTKLGAKIDQLTIYENIKPKKRPLPEKDINAVIFTSPSTVVNFLKDYDRIPSSWKIICKGPLTLKTLQKAGYKSGVMYGTI